MQGPGSPLRGVVLGASGREREVGLMPWRSQTYQDPQGVHLGSRCSSIQPMALECPVVPALNRVPWGDAELTRALPSEDFLLGGGDRDIDSNVEAVPQLFSDGCWTKCC